MFDHEPPLVFAPEEQNNPRDPRLVTWIEKSPVRIKWAKRTVGTLVLAIIAGVVILLQEPTEASRFKSLLKQPFSTLNRDEQGFVLLHARVDITDIQEAFHIREGLPVDEYGNFSLWTELREKYGINTPEELFSSPHFKFFLQFLRTPKAVPVKEVVGPDGNIYYVDLRTEAQLPVK